MTRWYYEKGGERQGPVAEEQLKELAASGQLQPTNLVWRKGMAEWQPARSVNGLDWPRPKLEDVPPPLPPAVPGGVVSPPVPLPGDARLTGTVESLRQYLRSFKVLRFSFPTSLFKPAMAFTNDAGQPALWIAKDDGIFVRSMTLWRDHTKTVPLLRVVGERGNFRQLNVVTPSGKAIGSLSHKFLQGWRIHLPDGRVIAPSNRVSAPKALIKIAAVVLTAGAALFVLMLLNPRPLWSLLSVGNSFSLMMDGQEVCAVKKQGAPFGVYYQVEDLSAVASKVDVALLVAALGMESTSALMTM